MVETAAARPWPSGYCVLRDERCGYGSLGRSAGARRRCKARGTIARGTCGGETDSIRAQSFSEIELGFPKKAIPEYAKQWGADLVMVGSHGQSALTRFLLGSVAHTVLRTSTCSVEIVRQSPVSSLRSHGIKILLATDGSECSAKAVYSSRESAVACEERDQDCQRGTASDTRKSGHCIASLFTIPTSLLEQIWKEARVRAEEAVADARKTLSAAGLKVLKAGDTNGGTSRIHS